MCLICSTLYEPTVSFYYCRYYSINKVTELNYVGDVKKWSLKAKV